MAAEPPNLRNRRARATIGDVAQQAGVSVGTVSHVLTNARAVGADRRVRVLAAVEQLGYQPNILAQGLRRTRSDVIGMCVPHTAFGYFAGLTAAVETLAAADGYEVMHVFSGTDAATETRRVELLLRFRVDGLVLLPGAAPQGTLNRLADAGLPTIIIDRPVDDRRFDQVTVDLRAVTGRAAAHLAGLGHRRLLFVTGNHNILISQRRIEGIRLALRHAGAGGTLEVMERGPSEEALAHRLVDALNRVDPPTAIIATNTAGIAWIVHTLARHGIACPGRVSLVAADEPDWASVVQPSLWTLHRPANEVARQGWALLLARLRGETGRPRRIEVEATLRPGDSVGPAPVRVGGHSQTTGSRSKRTANPGPRRTTLTVPAKSGEPE